MAANAVDEATVHVRSTINPSSATSVPSVLSALKCEVTVSARPFLSEATERINAQRPP